MSKAIFIIKILCNISFISTIRILNSFLVNTIYFRMRIMLLKQILILIASDYSRLNAEKFSGVQPFCLPAILVGFLNATVDSATFAV